MLRKGFTAAAFAPYREFFREGPFLVGLNVLIQLEIDATFHELPHSYLPGASADTNAKNMLASIAKLNNLTLLQQFFSNLPSTPKERA